MAHFRGVVQGNRGEGSRLGSKDSGITVAAQSWEGMILVRLHHKDGQDVAVVTRFPHEGSGGPAVVLYDGPVNMKEE